MEVDDYRKQIADEISNDVNIWNDVRENTSPGNYGWEDWEAEIDFNNIFVDIQKKIFTVKKGNFSADLLLEESGKDAITSTYSKSFKATGNFEYSDKSKIRIEDVNIEIDNNLF